MKTTHAPLLAQLESGTAAFRFGRAREHHGRVREATVLYGRILDAWRPGDETPMHDADGVVYEAADVFRGLVSTAKWHRERAQGQQERFRNLRSCGCRNVIATCGVCNSARKPVPVACGIVRLCGRCALVGAKQRRARFGRARARVICDADEIGYTRRSARGWAKWLDRMITLTAPHFHLTAVDPDSELGRLRLKDTTQARIWAVRLAWGGFLRRLNAHWKGNPKAKRPTPETVAILPRYEEDSEGRRVIVRGTPPYHRAFEWTPGADGLGHPHFHVWTFSPFLDKNLLREWWAEALDAVGCPIEGTREVVTNEAFLVRGKIVIRERRKRVPGYVRVDVRHFREVNVHAARELIKGGRDGALKLSRLSLRGGPKNAFSYADGWTVHGVMGDARPDVIASLYIALEGMRLSQGSRAFFGTDDPPQCECCGHHFFRVHFESREHLQPARVLDLHPRGPP